MPRPIVTFIGRLTADPVTIETSNGNKMAKFSVACNVESGPNKDNANFYDMVCFDKLAENAPKFLFKGSLAVVTAVMEQTTYQDKNGNTVKGMNYTVLNVNSIPVASKKADGEEGAAPAATSAPAAPAEDPDDIPF